MNRQGRQRDAVGREDHALVDVHAKDAGNAAFADDVTGAEGGGIQQAGLRQKAVVEGRVEDERAIVDGSLLVGERLAEAAGVRDGERGQVGQGRGILSGGACCREKEVVERSQHRLSQSAALLGGELGHFGNRGLGVFGVRDGDGDDLVGVHADRDFVHRAAVDFVGVVEGGRGEVGDERNFDRSAPAHNFVGVRGRENGERLEVRGEGFKRGLRDELIVEAGVDGCHKISKRRRGFRACCCGRTPRLRRR